MRQRTRKIARDIVKHMPTMVRGIRPKRDEFGNIERKDGKILYEDIGAAVQTQVWQVVLKLSQQVEDAPATKVELSTPGGIQVEVNLADEMKRNAALRAQLAALGGLPDDSG